MPIDFTLTPEQHALQMSARHFAREVLTEVKETACQLSTPMERFLATRPFYEETIKAGFLKRLIPSPFGGEGSGLLDMAIVAEEFEAVDVNVPLTLFSTMLGLMPVMLGGSPEQRQRFLAPFLKITGAPLAALASTEPGGSANLSAPAPAEGVRTKASLRDGSWIINGAKQWISSATGWDGRGADLISIVCRTDPSARPENALSIIVAERPTEGIILEKALNAFGHRAHLVPRFRIENMQVPQENILGTPGTGLRLVEDSFTGTAALVGVFGVAVMRAAFDFTYNFARKEYRGGNVPIIEHQAVGYALADAKAQIEAARYLSWRACHAFDIQAPGALELSLHAKIFSSEAAVKVITDLMRVVGVDSYDQDLPLAGLLADALAFPIFDGGNMGVRRRQLHTLLKNPGYDPLATF